MVIVARAGMAGTKMSPGPGRNVPRQQAIAFAMIRKIQHCRAPDSVTFRNWRFIRFFARLFSGNEQSFLLDIANAILRAQFYLGYFQMLDLPLGGARENDPKEPGRDLVEIEDDWRDLDLKLMNRLVVPSV